MVDIEQLELLYFQNDEPIPYKLKNDGKEYMINVEPILVKDWTLFENCLDVLLFEKQDYNDIDIISMSYLDFIVKILIEVDINYQTKLGYILKKSCGIDVSIGTNGKGKICLWILDEAEMPISIITSKEFDELKKIILFQNIYDYDDRYISPYIKQLYNDYISTIKTEAVDPSFERKKTYVISKTGILMNEINKMSYRVFYQIYNELVETDLYYANKILQASEKYEFKKDVCYPLFEKKKDKYDSLFVSKSSVEGKLGKING